MTASNFREIMKEANKLAGQIKEEPSVLSKEGQEVNYIVINV